MTLKEQILEVMEKYPDFIEWLEREYDFSFCPPGTTTLSPDQLDELCYRGCEMCWKTYKNSKVETLKE